jgi:hypothetical protein
MVARVAFVLAVAGAVGWSLGCGGTTQHNQGAATDDGAGDDAGGGDGASGNDAAVMCPQGCVGPMGGSVPRLLFTVIGDTRPPTMDDIGAYPTPVINKIYADVAALNPAPLFSLSTGDYQYSSTYNGQASAQLDLYLAARAKFSGMFFPAMGNHECTGGTASNCGSGNTDGTTDNFKQFLGKMLGPIQKTEPYYSININASDGSWTSKFVLIAANAWDAKQASWFQNTMGQKTTYTFVVRHEASSVTDAPGVGPSNLILGANPYTLLIVGHSHTYEHPNSQEVLFGNGGAPLSSGSYGYGLFAQRDDGAIEVDAMDYDTNKPDSSFHFVVKADGTPTK